MEESKPEPDEMQGSELSSAEKLSGLSGKDKDAVEAQSRPNAALIHETIRAEGEAELDRSASALLLSGVAAGLSMGFSFITPALVRASIAPAPWRPLIAHLGYTVGFLIVVLGRQQLFTENTLTPVLPLLHNRDRGTLTRLLRLWILVLTANVIGAIIVASVVAGTDLFDTDIKRNMTELAAPVFETPFWTTVLKAIFAGWLIALMVWLLPAADGARPLIIIIVTYVVALGEFSHIIAGSVDGWFLVSLGEATVGDFLSRFFVPTLIGNTLGGVTLVAVLNYGQVAPQLK